MSTMTLPRTPPGAERPFSAEALRRRGGRLLRESTYLLLSWPVLLAAFVVIFTLLAVGLTGIVVWFGFPLLALALLLSRGLATGERAVQAGLLGRVVPPGAYRPADPDAGLMARITAVFRDGQNWADLGFALVAWLVSTITWSVALVWWVAAVGGFVAPVVDLASSPGLHRSLTFGFMMSFDQWTSILLDVVVGVLAALSLPWVIQGLATLQATLFGAILGAGGLQRQVAGLQTSRRAAHDAEAAALRKLERDLHDGPQQRLVRLQMDLGRALQQVDQDPARARSAMESSLTQAQETLAELRNLSRGIAPPILVDRGLIVALDELTARSAVPARLTTNLPRDRRPDHIPPRVQDAAFYVVSEALTNAAKHGGATSAEVAVYHGEGLLRVTVRDDGRGGATYGGGTGLAGLRDRLAGLDGSLEVHSPVGGPTVLTAVLPC